MNARLVPALRRAKDRDAAVLLRRLGLADRAVVHHLAGGHLYDYQGDPVLVRRDASMGIQTTTVLLQPRSLTVRTWPAFLAALAEVLPADRLVVRGWPAGTELGYVGLEFFQHWVTKAPSARPSPGDLASVRPARDAADHEFAEDLLWRSFIAGFAADHPRGWRDSGLIEVLIADVGGHRAGHLTWEIRAEEVSRQPHAVMIDIAVLEEYTGRGVGSALAAELERRQVVQRAPLPLAGGVSGPVADRLLDSLLTAGWRHRFSTWGIGRWAAQ